MSNVNSQAAERLTPVFAALGDTTRLQLVHRLATGEARSIAQLANGLGLTHQGITKHLKVLETAGLVKGDKVGRERRFTCNPDTLQDAQSYLSEVAAQWDDALQRLQTLVESDA